MSDPASIPSKSKHSIPSQRRLHACDAIRGLLLAIGFADHIDAATYSTLGLRDWTLAGLGLSDASDGFVCLSGFVFGYAYSCRLQNAGIRKTCWHGCIRVMQIYMGYALCVTTIRLLKYLAFDQSFLNWEDWQRELFLVHMPTNTSVLGLYIVALPWLLALFALLSR